MGNTMRMLWYLIAVLTAVMLSCSSDKPAKGVDDDLIKEDGDISDTSDEMADDEGLLSDDELLVSDEGYPSPEPDTCAFIGANCGEVTLDGGKKLSCGECADPDTCGGGGTPNVCGHQLCDEGWCWEHPYPQGDDLNDIYALDATHVWAIGDRAVLFYNGVSWEGIPYQLRQGGNMQAIYAADADHVWAVATDGCILFLKDGVLSCNKELDGDGFPIYWSENEQALYDIHGTGPNDIWAVGFETILHWDGTEWTTNYTPAQKLNAVWAVDATTVYAGGEKTLLRYSGVWNEESYTEIINDIFAVAPDDIWAVGDISSVADGRIMHYDGSEWLRETPRDDYVAITAVGGLGPEQVVMGDASGRLFRKWSYGGEPMVGREVPLPLASGAGINAISAVDGKIWFVGEHGLIGSWDTKFLTTNRPRLPIMTKAIFANSHFDVWIAGDRFFGHWNGTTWQFMATEESITDLYGSAHNDIYAETAEGYLHYDGTRWSEAKPDTATVTALKAARAPFFRSSDDGTTEGVWWCFELEDCWGFQDTLFIRGTDTELIKTAEWPFEGLGDYPNSALSNACATDDGQYWAARTPDLLRYDGKKWRTFELDEVFDAIATALTCEGNTVWVADMGGNIRQVTNGALEEMWSFSIDGEIQHLDRSVEGTLYAMTDIEMGNGVLYRVVGQNAEKVTIPGDPPLLSFAAIADDDIWAGGANALYHWDGTEWTTTLPADLTDRGLPTGETEVYLARIFAIDAENIWMLGASPDGATAYIFSYDGTKWVNDARTSLYGELAFTDVWATDQQNAFITMNAEGWIYHYKNLGSVGMIDYVSAPAGTPFSAIAGRAGEEMRIFAPGGAILRYDF